MPKRSSTRPRDLNQLAYQLVQEATGQAPKTAAPVEHDKDPAAVALGRKGGLKGGKARAAKMTAKQRSAQARKAAATRWERQRDGETD